MSKEAASYGQILGSLSYFNQVNRSMFRGNLQHGEGFDYYRVLRELASRADGAINSIYKNYIETVNGKNRTTRLRKSL